MKHRRRSALRGRRLAVAALLAVALPATTVSPADAAASAARSGPRPAARPSAPSGGGDVIANLWEWNWRSVATE